MCLVDFGWTNELSKQFTAVAVDGLDPGRVVRAARGEWEVQSQAGLLRAWLRGSSSSEFLLPVVGDWVAHRPVESGVTRIETVLPRRTTLSRKAPGNPTREQVLAANVDTVLVVSGLDGDFNLRRLERMLALVRESGAVPVLVLNKADLAPDLEEKTSRVEEIAGGVAVVGISARTGVGIEELQACLRPRETFALIGSSGVGKSTLVNRLCGSELMRTAAVRSDDSRGRHTTSHRELVRLPGGALLIDSPGLREVQLWASEESLEGTFDEIGRLARQCRFRDCAHQTEPGCAVLAAVRAGTLEPDRLESFRKLTRELRYLDRKQDVGARLAEKRKWKMIHRSMRYHPKGRG